VTNRGRTLTWTAADGLETGVHMLALDEVIGTSGKVLGAGGRIPFRVTASKARVSSTIRIEHFVRLRRGPQDQRGERDGSREQAHHAAER
jgi:hypothetical protein